MTFPKLIRNLLYLYIYQSSGKLYFYFLSLNLHITQLKSMIFYYDIGATHSKITTYYRHIVPYLFSHLYKSRLIPPCQINAYFVLRVYKRKVVFITSYRAQLHSQYIETRPLNLKNEKNNSSESVCYLYVTKYVYYVLYEVASKDYRHIVYILSKEIA